MNKNSKTMNIFVSTLLFLALVVGLAMPTFRAQAVGTTVLVGVLQPAWGTPGDGGGGVFSAYIGPDAYDYVSPGTTAVYDGREAGIIKAGLAVDPTSGNYEDEGLFGFKPTVTIDDFAVGPLTFDVENQYGENPVWMTIDIDTGVVGDRADDTVYQSVPTTNPAGWHTVDAAAGLWQKWNNNNGDVSGNPKISLSDVAATHTGLNVVRAYLRLGMGNSYHGVAGLGTVAWVDKVTLGTVTYDFVSEYWYVATTGSDSNLGNLVSPFLTIQHAISAAASGDTIHVAAGTYAEQLSITKPLTLTGEDGAVLDGATLPAGWTTGVKIRSGNVTFNNIDVTNYTQDGITAYDNIDMPNLHITNSKISNIQPGYWGFGIYVGYESEGFGYVPPDLTTHLDFSGLLIEGNEITNVHSSALVVQSLTGTPDTLVVRNNNIHDNTTNSGIWIDCARNLLIEDNIVDANKWGIEISCIADESSANPLEGLYGPKDITLSGNTITNSTAEGIYMYAGWPGTFTVTGNIIQGNVAGLNNTLATLLNAAPNWWGAVSGPSGVGPGSGDSITTAVGFSPWCGDAACTILIYLNPPPTPSSFWGYIHFNDGAPGIGSNLVANISGVTSPASFTLLNSTNYAFNVPGDITGTSGKEGGAEGDLITFTIDGRVVATNLWHGGTNDQMDLHPPMAISGGPYVGLASTSISLSGSVSDWLTPDTFTYAWDLDNTGPYETAGQTTSFSSSIVGTYPIGLKVTDGQNGEGYASTNVTVITVDGLTGQTYDGTSKSVTVMGVDSPLTYSVTYGGSLTEPTDAGTYAVVITLSNGAVFSGINLEIGQASSSVMFTCPASVTYTGSPLTPCTAAATGAGSLNVPLTVNYSNNTNVGTATASATFDGDINHTGSTNSTTFDITAATATIVSVGNLNPVSGIDPIGVTVTTSPLAVVTTATYSGNGYGPSTTPPTAPGTYSVVVAITDPNYTGSPVTVTMHIQTTCTVTGLLAGWNLVSVCLAPVNTAPGTVLNSLSGSYDLVYGWDGSLSSNNWLKFAPGGPPYANNMASLNEKMGFWVHMTAPGTLTVTGYPPVTTDIPLYSVASNGWNLVGYPSLTAMSLPGSLHDFTLIYTYHAADMADPWKLFDIVAPSFVNDLTSLTATWGYWIKVTSPASYTWTVAY